MSRDLVHVCCVCWAGAKTQSDATCAVTMHDCCDRKSHGLRYDHAWLLRHGVCLHQVGKGPGGRHTVSQGLRSLL